MRAAQDTAAFCGGLALMSMTSPEDVAQPVAAGLSLYICTPAYGCLVTNAYLSSLVMLRSALGRHGVASMVQLTGNESLVQRARNLMTAQFLESRCTHMLWIDADLAFEAESVLAMLRFDKDVTAAIYSKKSINWERAYNTSLTEPVAQRGLDYNINMVGDVQLEDGRFCQVLDAATGFMLIKRSVVERMCEAYTCLRCVNDIPGSDIKEYTALYDCLIDPESRRYLSEDYAFCRRWQLLGGKIYACLRSPMSHIGSFMYRPVEDMGLPAGVVAAAAASKG